MRPGAVIVLLFAAPAAGQSPAADSGFVLSTADPSRSPSPFIGSGRLGVVVPALGVGSANSFMTGLYEEAVGDVPRIVRIPAWTLLQPCAGQECLDSSSVTAGEIQGYRQALDLHTGMVRTKYRWVGDAGCTDVVVETLVSRARPHTGAARLTLTPAEAGRLRVRFALAGRPPPPRLALGRIERAEPGWSPSDVWYPGHMIVVGRTAEPGRRGARLTMTSAPEGRRTRLFQLAEVTWPAGLRHPSARVLARGDTALVELAFQAEGGRAYSFSQIVTASLPGRSGSPGPANWDALVGQNDSAWARLWRSDIEIRGNAELQRVVRAMLFYLLSSAAEGTALGIPPMGLSSGGYYGHIFWDSDTWMLPPLLLTHPEVARSLVDFRGHTLAAARENARVNGRRGAMYPWEADERGRETTPRFAIQNARSEIHVTGDVALAQWQYWLATGDSVWLAREGYPVIRETADFWVSRATRDSAGRYHIEDVVSVSEGLIGVTDDAYTNAVARRNLEIAGEASRKLGLPGNPAWMTVAAGLHLPYDSASDFYRTYAGAPDSTLGDVTPLLVYPLGVPMSSAAKRAQVEQAIRRLLARGPGAMMGSTLLSVDAAELGDRGMVDSLLPLSYRPHLRGPFLLLSETPSNDAVNFVTGAGGFLQQVIFGYTGLRFGANGVEPRFPSVLPSSVERLVLRGITIRGSRYDVVVDSAGRRIVPWIPEGLAR